MKAFSLISKLSILFPKISETLLGDFATSFFYLAIISILLGFKLFTCPVFLIEARFYIFLLSWIWTDWILNCPNFGEALYTTFGGGPTTVSLNACFKWSPNFIFGYCGLGCLPPLAACDPLRGLWLLLITSFRFGLVVTLLQLLLLLFLSRTLLCIWIECLLASGTSILAIEVVDAHILLELDGDKYNITYWSWI